MRVRRPPVRGRRTRFRMAAPLTEGLTSRGACLNLAHLPAPPAGTRRLRTLRSLLAALIAATLLPLVAFAVVMVVRTARDERAANERRFTESARALADLLDREMMATTRALEALGASAALERDDVAAFREEAL